MKRTTPIPVTLVTGFLGSGKTTFLLRLAQSHPREKILFLVNEFARDNIDGTTLATSGRPTHSVVGGSLFCECKAADFVRLMRQEVTALYHRDEITHVVIETSGIADPSAIGRLMDQHGLSADFEIRRIVNIISPLRFPRLLANLPSVRAQVQACDTVIINQTDLASAAQIERLYRLVSAANPGATLLSADHCDLPFDLNGRTADRTLPTAPLSTCDANPFTTATVTFERPVRITALRAWLEALPPAVLRVKGRVRTSAGWREVQHTVGNSAITLSDHEDKSCLVVITHDRNEPTLHRVVRKLQSLNV